MSSIQAKIKYFSSAKIILKRVNVIGVITCAQYIILLTITKKKLSMYIQNTNKSQIWLNIMFVLRDEKMQNDKVKTVEKYIPINFCISPHNSLSKSDDL